MPYEIVRNDITNMIVDAIVNTANPLPIVGSGVDHAIHQKAGPELLKEREKIGRISVGVKWSPCQDHVPQIYRERASS